MSIQCQEEKDLHLPGPTPGVLFTVAYTDVGIDATDESIATAKIIIFIFN
jgi:hypothetical protein